MANRIQPAASKDCVGELKLILENAATPDRLDGHPWAQSLIVRQSVARDPSLRRKSPGYQLLFALSGLFCETMPSTPPKRGKRLDTNWGQFGILAAMYFAPFKFGTVRPVSLLDAWGRIDQVIPLFVYNKSAEHLPEDQLARYQLISDEVEGAPSSTVSDWHVKALERLAQLFLSREQYLSDQLGQPSVVLLGAAWSAPSGDGNGNGDGAAAAVGVGLQATDVSNLWRQIAGLYRRHARQFWIGLALLAALFFGWKGVRIYTLMSSVRGDMAQIRSLASANLDAGTLASAGPLLASARRDVAELRSEAAPFLWAGPLVVWLPVYGPDLAAAKPLLDLASGVTVAADEAYQSLWPVWSVVQAEKSNFDPPRFLAMFVEAQPRLMAADEAIKQAIAARAAIDPARLSARRRADVETLDPYLPLLRDGLAAATILPKLLGAEGFGSQTYLILLQNEDELRATGGFITAVGTVTVDRGQMASYTLEDSYAIDDLSKPYLPAPWQLDQYMYSHLWMLRDSNWSPDFPTSATLAEHLYTYTRPHSLDGVIALDQAAIRLLLQGVGPVEVDGATGPVTADNVIAYMRSAKAPVSGEALDQEWWRQRKDFMRRLGASLVAKLQLDTGLSWSTLGGAMLQALDERHVLVQLDDPTAAAVLADRRWDGAVRPGSADYLMVVDSNLGFNKANAAVETTLAYAIDLSHPDTPTATLTVTHRNPTPGPAGCKQAPDYGTGSYADLIARCYWDYLRVYVPAGAKLVEATPQAVPGEWMIRGEPVPARVDRLDETDGVSAFGTLLVVPLGETVQTIFSFSLPSSVLTVDGSGRAFTYRLHIQKQAGTGAIPIQLDIHLPLGVQVTQASPNGAIGDNVWTLDSRLNTDIDVHLAFIRP